MAILRQSPVAHLGEPELSFHDAKNMFHLGADARFILITGALHFSQLAVPTTLVLGRAGRVDNRGVYDSTATDLQPVLVQILINQVEQMITQIVLLHQVAELANCGFVGHWLLAKVNANEAAHGAGIVEGFSAAGSERLNQCCRK